MSLRLLVDEDTEARMLVRLLRETGHNVLMVVEAGISGQSDDRVLNFASVESRILLTRNADDFRILHTRIPSRAGILAIYQDHI